MKWPKAASPKTIKLLRRYNIITQYVLDSQQHIGTLLSGPEQRQIYSSLYILLAYYIAKARQRNGQTWCKLQHDVGTFFLIKPSVWPYYYLYLSISLACLPCYEWDLVSEQNQFGLLATGLPAQKEFSLLWMFSLFSYKGTLSRWGRQQGGVDLICLIVNAAYLWMEREWIAWNHLPHFHGWEWRSLAFFCPSLVLV